MNPNICNNCAGTYEYRNGRWKCPYCGSYKPEELSNEEVTLLYQAAQKLRLCDFDSAEASYSDIIEKFPQNPNGYWGRLLAKYGIKYEDDFDGRKIPTCYATSMKSVTADKDFQKAISLADTENREFYQNQASYMENVRREWVEKAKKERPYDIFISYKESDLENHIERTEDSIAVQDLYIHLTEQGYRVFYSRESLRDKTGEKYEPYIFNALSTAKVMLVYGSSPEYIKSTWLKNEWHRFYKKVADGEKHPEALIVACDGFSPNDLPSILSSRQCLDAKRKTFFLDLDKCIKRIIEQSSKFAPKKEPTEQEKVHSALHEHTYKTEIVKSTCIAKGYTAHRCDCGYEYRDSYTPLVDHSFKLTEQTPPTCTDDGREKKTCVICGEKTTVLLPALDHQFSKWIETTHAICTEAGEKQRKCLRCGHTESAPIPNTGHQFGDWIANSDGTHTAFCNRCGFSKTREKNVFSRDAEKNVPQNAVLPFSQIIKNHTNYWKSYFTEETTKTQKIRKLYGILVLISFFSVMVATSLDPLANHPLSIAVFLLFSASLFLGFLVLAISVKSTIKRKAQPGLAKSEKRVRIGFWIASRFFFFCTAMAVIIQTLSMFLFMLVWGLLFLFFAFTPRAYKKIGFGKHVSIPKFVFVLSTAIISIICTSIGA